MSGRPEVGRAILAYYEMFSSIVDLDTSSICDNQKCLQSLPNVPIEWWRTTILEGYLTSFK